MTGTGARSGAAPTGINAGAGGSASADRVASKRRRTRTRTKSDGTMRTEGHHRLARARREPTLLSSSTHPCPAFAQASQARSEELSGFPTPFSLALPRTSALRIAWRHLTLPVHAQGRTGNDAVVDAAGLPLTVH